MHLGATLRLLRVESGLSLRDLARRLSVSGAYLSRVENGLDAAPTARRLEAIARELDLPPALLMGLAHRVSPLVVDYVHAVPNAGTLLLEIAHRRLDAAQIAEVLAFLDERFPTAPGVRPRSPRGITDLLAPERIVLKLACSGFDDVLDVAAGRLAAVAGAHAAALAGPLKERERELASAIGGGVAVPCAYVAGATPAAVLVTLDPPLPQATPDGQPLRVVIGLVGPRDSPERRLGILSVARLTARGLVERLASVSAPGVALQRVAELERQR